MAASIDAATRSKIIVAARRWIGRKYDFSHADMAWRDLTVEPEVFDCSAFVCRVAMEAFGYTNDRVERSASWLLDNLCETKTVAPGDVVGYGREALRSDGALGHQIVWHVMLYIGSGHVIGACDITGRVAIRPMTYEDKLGPRRWQPVTPPFRALKLK